MAETVCPNCAETFASGEEACPACGHLVSARACERHPDRAAEGQCAVCGRAVCDGCNQPQGKHYVCEEHVAVPLISGWAQVYSAADDIEAELIRENLVADGIEARVLSQRDHFSFAVDVGELNEVRVLVPAYAYDEAMAEIRDHTATDGELVFACPNCGEAYDAGETTCSACGATLPVTWNDPAA